MAEHWCKEHKQPFFKKGKMKGFAHPILDDDGEPTGEWCNEKETELTEKPPATGRTYGKSDAELAQHKQLEEAKQRSIQAQTALIQATNLAVAGKVTMQGPQDLKPIMLVAREFYKLLQSLTQISEAEVIHSETERHKNIPEGETTTPRQEETGEAGQDPQSVPELMKWAISHGKEFHPTRIKKELGDVMPEEMKVAVNILKEKFDWKD